MGYMRHHIIAVSSSNEKLIESIRSKAIEIFKKIQVTQIHETPVNDDYVFFVCPDGSKEGWEESEIGNSRRSAFIELIDTYADDGGDNEIRYSEMFFADERGNSVVTRHN